MGETEKYLECKCKQMKFPKKGQTHYDITFVQTCRVCGQRWESLHGKPRRT